MRSCRQPFSISCNKTAGCIDWNSLQWGLSWGGKFIIITEGASGDIDRDTDKGSTFHIWGIAPDSVYDLFVIENDASVDYNSPGCNCRLRVTIAVGSTPSLINGFVQVESGNLEILYTYGFDAMSIGVNEFVFALPDTHGISDYIRIWTYIQNKRLGGYEAIDAQCELTVV